MELENANGTITLVIPYSTIEPIKQKLSSGFQVESDQTDKTLWASIIQEQLVETDVDIKVDLGYTEITLARTYEFEARRRDFSRSRRER